MKTTRLIARFLQAKAAIVRRQCIGECLMSLGISLAVTMVQFAFYFLVIWSFAFGKP